MAYITESDFVKATNPYTIEEVLAAIERDKARGATPDPMTGRLSTPPEQFYKGYTPQTGLTYSNIPEYAKARGLRKWTPPPPAAAVGGAEMYGTKPLPATKEPSRVSFGTQTAEKTVSELANLVPKTSKEAQVEIDRMVMVGRQKGYKEEDILSDINKRNLIKTRDTLREAERKAEVDAKKPEFKVGGTKEQILEKIARGGKLTDAENEAWKRIEAVEVAGAKEAAKGEARAEVEKKVSYPKVKATIISLENQWDNMDRFIDTAIKQITPFSAGAGAWSSVLPLTPARNLAGTLSTIAANIGFDKLQDMRQNSPTGGALGQVSDFENKLLQAVQGSLEQGQSPGQLISNLNNIKALLKLTREQKKAAFQQDFGKYEQPGTAATGGGIESRFPQKAAQIAAARAEGYTDDQIEAFLGGR